MLFAMQTRHVTLEDAANVLIGEEEEGQTKYKSKTNYMNCNWIKPLMGFLVLPVS